MLKQTPEMIQELINEHTISDNYLTLDLDLLHSMNWNTSELVLFHLIKRHMKYNQDAIIENGGWFYWKIENIMGHFPAKEDKIRSILQKFEQSGLFKTERRRGSSGTLKWYQYQGTQSLTADAGCACPKDGFSRDGKDGIFPGRTLHINNNIQNNTRARGERKTSKNRRGSTPKQQTPDIDPKFIELASKWEPKLSKNRITDKQITRAAKVLQKLVVEFEFTFEEIELGIEWAYNDRTGSGSFPGWHYHFSTLSGLDHRNTGSKSNSEDIKFQKIHNARMRSIQVSPEEIFKRRIESTIRSFWDQPEDEKHVQRCLNDIDWFQNRLERINQDLPSKNKFLWHEGNKFLDVVSFLIHDIEAVSTKTFKYVMKDYLEYLQYKLQDGSLNTLYPGYFAKSSEVFRRHLAEDYNVTGRKLVDWQKGDFDE